VYSITRRFTSDRQITAGICSTSVRYSSRTVSAFVQRGPIAASAGAQVGGDGHDQAAGQRQADRRDQRGGDRVHADS
jgi:hypothetical protein